MTGVQTCALPICAVHRETSGKMAVEVRRRDGRDIERAAEVTPDLDQHARIAIRAQRDERPVGIAVEQYDAELARKTVRNGAWRRVRGGFPGCRGILVRRSARDLHGCAPLGGMSTGRIAVDERC